MTPPGMPMEVYEYGDPAASAVRVQPADEHDLSAITSEIDEIRRLSTREFRLLAVKIGNWNRDLSPWEAPAVFGKETVSHLQDTQKVRISNPHSGS